MTKQVDGIYGVSYHSKGPNDLRLSQRVFKFFRDNSEFNNSGQGVIGVSCPKLWEMSDERFKAVFGIASSNQK